MSYLWVDGLPPLPALARRRFGIEHLGLDDRTLGILIAAGFEDAEQVYVLGSEMLNVPNVDPITFQVIRQAMIARYCIGHIEWPVPRPLHLYARLAA